MLKRLFSSQGSLDVPLSPIFSNSVCNSRLPPAAANTSSLYSAEPIQPRHRYSSSSTPLSSPPSTQRKTGTPPSQSHPRAFFHEKYTASRRTAWPSPPSTNTADTPHPPHTLPHTPGHYPPGHPAPAPTGPKPHYPNPPSSPAPQPDKTRTDPQTPTAATPRHRQQTAPEIHHDEN